MERPERPSRHSKSHDKWKRIIKPAESDTSSSDWSDLDSDTAPRGVTRPYYAQSDPSGASSSSNTHQTPAITAGNSSNNNNNNNNNSSSINNSTTNSTHDRIRSILPSLDYSTLLARYSGGSNKRPLDNADSAHNYHLLHHDYAERDSYRPLPGENYPWYVRASSNLDRKRQRLLRNAISEDPTHDEDNEREDIDNANLLCPLSISSGSSRPSAVFAASSQTAAPESSDMVRVDLEAATASSVIVQSNPTAARRCEYRCASPVAFADWERRYSTHRNLSNPFSKTSSKKVRPASPQLEQRPNPTRMEEGDVQVISMAGPSTSTVAPATGLRFAIRARPKEKPACEEVIIVEDQTATEVPPSAPPVPTVEAPTSDDVPASPALPPRPRGGVSAATEEETLNQGLIGLLECPVCMEYMSPPIHQCRRGHLVCVNCKPKLPLCPTCRSRLTDSRNLAMEKVADKLLYPCKNGHVGCVEQLRLKDKEEHEANCDYRAYRCLLPQCEWKGFKDQLLSHNQTKHKEKLLFGSQQMLALQLGDLATSTNQNWIVSTLDELFRVNFVMVKSGQRVLQLFETGSCRMQLLGCVQYIGPQRNAAAFEYTLETKRSVGSVKRSVSFARSVHNDLVKCAVNYAAGDSFYLRGDTAELLSEGSQGEAVLLIHLGIQRAGE